MNHPCMDVHVEPMNWLVSYCTILAARLVLYSNMSQCLFYMYSEHETAGFYLAIARSSSVAKVHP